MFKLTSLLLLPLLAHGAVVPLESRQLQLPPGLPSGILSLLNTLDPSRMGGMASMVLPTRKAFKVEQVTPKTTVPNAKRIKIVYGPYTLKSAKNTAKVGNGYSMDKGGTSYMDLIGDDFPKNIMVLETISELQNPDFTRASTDQGIYNHHNVFMDFTKPVDVFGCEAGHKETSQIPLTVFTAGATEVGMLRYYAEDGAIKSGYYIPETRQMLNMIDVINYNDAEKEVYTSTEIEYLEGKPAGYVPTSQQRVDPGICGGQSGAFIHPPKGQTKFSVKSSNIIALRDGWIVNARGHMHDGGIDIQFKVNDKEVCDSRAIYGGDGHVAKTADGKVWETIRESSYCNTTIPIKKGDKIFMQANYDTELHPSREQGGMGGHGGGSMGGMKMRNVLDGGSEAAEQMAMMVTHFALAN